MFWENVKLAFRSMWLNKMRTFLSLLGIVIGVGSVVAILSLGTSATKSITSAFTSGGTDLISVYVSATGKEGEVYDEYFSQEIAANVEGISFAFPVATSSAKVRRQQKLISATISGTPSTYAGLMNYPIAEGSWFSMEDNIFKRQVCVLGSNVAEDLFPDGNAVGQYISIYRNQSKSYLVVGVMKSKDAQLSVSFNNYVYVPYNTYDQRIRKVSRVGTYIAKVEEGYSSNDVTDDLEAYLNEMAGSDSYTTFSAATIADIASEVMAVLSAFLAAIAAISLVVGGIGIMNIMLVSVAERTREIGIRKALGATQKAILGQFITEAVALTMFGGFIGILLGAGITLAVSNIQGWEPVISKLSYILGFGVSMVIGVFFGWYPAKKAAQLDPIQSLSYE